MMVRKMAYVGFSYMAGLFFASFFALWVSFSLASALAAGAAVWLIILSKEKLRDIRAFKIILCSFSCAAGIFLYCGYDIVVYRSITAYDGAEVISEAVVSEVSSIGNDKCLYIVSGRLNGGIKAKFGFFGENRGLSKGDSLTVHGEMYIPENTEAFSGRDHYKARGVFLFMKSADIISCTVKENSLYKYSGRLRNMIMSQIRRLIPSEEGELLIGMLLGSEYHRLDGKTERLLYRSGIGHVTAVSGMHLAIACGVICSLASAVIRTSRTKFFAAFITAAFFCIMTDFSPSVVRSAVMLLLTYTGGMWGRKADSLNSLGIAVILLTAAAPYSVRNTGLLLSLAGAMGTGVMAPYLIRLIDEHRNKDTFPTFEDRQPSALLSSAVSSFSAACAVFPVAVMRFDEVSVISPLVNLLLSPFYTAALAVSVFAVMLLPLKAVSDGLFLAAGLLCKPVLGAAKLAGAAEFAVIPLGLPPVVPCTVIGGIFTVAVLVLTHDGKYTSAAFSLSAAVFTVVVSVYRLIPSDSMYIAVLTDSSGCAAVIYGDSSAVIIDMSAEKECAFLTENYLAAMGIDHAGLVMLTKKSGYTESLYRSFLSETEYISDTEVSDTDNALKCSFDGFDIIITPSEGNYTVDITKEGGGSCRAAFLCGEGDISLENADLAVFNRKKGCDASDGECMYLVTNEKYEGVFSASSDYNYCVSSVYSFSGEKLSAVSD
ncbi:MAG: ComEC/Rec2 family competence protein [Huintestinicola sp.]